MSIDIRKIVSYTLMPRGGVKPVINEAHIMKVLITLYKSGPLGRQALSKILGVGESSVRTLIRRLKELNIVNVSKAGGAFLTEKGETVIKEFLKKVVPPMKIDVGDLDYLRLSENACFTILRNACEKSINVLRIRDSIIRYGAEAALIICARKSRLVLISPQGNGIDETTIKELDSLRNRLNVKLYEHDLILISYADSLEKCESSLYKFIISEGTVQSEC